MKKDFKTKEFNKEAALLWACKHGHLDVVKLLTSKGADLNFYGSASLDMACWKEHVDVVEFLLQKGALVTPRIWRSVVIWGNNEVYNAFRAFKGWETLNDFC